MESASWFKYGELIDDWLDLPQLEVGKRGHAFKNRLAAEDGVRYFKDILRPHFIKGAQSVSLWRFYQFIRARRENTEMVNWIGTFSLFLKRLRDAWMDMLPMSAMNETRRQNQYLADVTRENEERQEKK